ncbi:hypothetical protein O9993_09460 [Vibrio lentus]|nr:hypothetical protein [Vibrio lentus]
MLDGNSQRPACVAALNILQGVESRRHLLCNLNQSDAIAPDKVIRSFVYTIIDCNSNTVDAAP